MTVSLEGGRLARWKREIAAEIEASGGRHDEAEIYGGPSGDPGLAGGPESLSWEIHGDLATWRSRPGDGADGSFASIRLAAARPLRSGRSRAGARNTLGYVLRTTFGSSDAALRVIEGVKRVHSRIEGARPDGVRYRALDPELIAWVHTSITWGVMTAYDRYARPLTLMEKNRYLKEQAPIGLLGGADWVPQTMDELADYVEQMRPKLALSAQTLRFVDFISGRPEPDRARRPVVPRSAARRDGPDAAGAAATGTSRRTRCAARSAADRSPEGA
jgi:uncharacterized protein (DUF2236 family)